MTPSKNIRAAKIDPAGAPRGATDSERSTRLLATGGIVAALGAASCCVVPFALFTLGVSGAWIGNLTALEPYQPIFAAVAAGLIGYGFYMVYRKQRHLARKTPTAPDQARGAW